MDKRLPEEYEKCLVGLNSILKEAWTMSQTDSSVKSDKIKALAAMKLELFTNATVVDDAIRFVSDRSKEELKSLNNGNEARDQLDEEQEKETREINQTANQLF